MSETETMQNVAFDEYKSVLANRIPQEIGSVDDDTLRLVLDNLNAAHRDMWDEFRDEEWVKNADRGVAAVKIKDTKPWVRHDIEPYLDSDFDYGWELARHCLSAYCLATHAHTSVSSFEMMEAVDEEYSYIEIDAQTLTRGYDNDEH